MVNPRQVVARFISSSVFWALLLPLFFVAFSSLAFGQTDFTITSTGLQNPVLEPGLDTGATIILQPNPTTATGTPVTLTCTVTTTQVTTFLPQCVPSPPDPVPSAQASITVDTQAASPPGAYNVIVTGTSGTFTHSITLGLNIVPESADYTIAVTTAVSPTSVAAGNGAQATVTVTPIGNYSGHQITLSCLSVTPVVAASPVCAFKPEPVTVASNTTPTSVLTITTFGTATGGISELRTMRIFYGLWLAMPGLALMGACSRGRRRKNILGLLLLMAIASGVLFMPACGSSSNNGTRAPNGDSTPNGTYMFTLSAVDETGAAPSNITTSPASVSLTVTTP